MHESVPSKNTDESHVKEQRRELAAFLQKHPVILCMALRTTEKHNQQTCALFLEAITLASADVKTDTHTESSQEPASFFFTPAHWHDVYMVQCLQYFLRRYDRIVVYKNAKPVLRWLLSKNIDVARPVCLASLDLLAHRAWIPSPASHQHEALSYLDAFIDLKNIKIDMQDDQESKREVAAWIRPQRESLRERAQNWLLALSGFQIRITLTHNQEQTDVEITPVMLAGFRAVSRLESLSLRVFAAIEHSGLPIDAAAWRTLIKRADDEKKKARKVLEIAWSKYVEKDLFGAVQLPLESDISLRALVEKHVGFALSDVTSSTLRSIGPDDPVLQALVDYREANKLVSTYGDGFLQHVGSDGRLHGIFIPLGTSTGRVACREPNLQNLPSDVAFHQAIHADDNRMLITADYGTCELRILAEMSGDARFIEAFCRGDDLHSTVATQMFQQPVSKTENPHLRQKAKAINFGLVYGMGAAALAMQVGVSRDEAQDLLQQYFAQYPSIRQFLDGSVGFARKYGYVETILGRRLAIDTTRDEGEWGRLAKNMPIQGTSADMTKLALIRIHERFHDERWDARIVNTVHDEIVVECASQDAETIAHLVRVEMTAAHQTLLKRVPALVEVQIARYWQH